MCERSSGNECMTMFVRSYWWAFRRCDVYETLYICEHEHFWVNICIRCASWCVSGAGGWGVYVLAGVYISGCTWVYMPGYENVSVGMCVGVVCVGVYVLGRVCVCVMSTHRSTSTLLARGRVKAESGSRRRHTLPGTVSKPLHSHNGSSLRLRLIFLFSIYVALWICRLLYNWFY